MAGCYPAATDHEKRASTGCRLISPGGSDKRRSVHEEINIVRTRPAVRIKSPEKRARIGERIKLAATSAGLTLKELAEKANTAPALIYQYVRGITNVPPETLQAIAAVTKVSLEFFDPDKDTRSAFALPSETEPPPDRERVVSDLRHLQQLAEAYDDPKRNLSALLSTLHEMLGSARALGDRRQEAYILWRLGVHRCETGEYEEARSHLIQARDMFAELGMEEYRVAVVQDLARAVAELGAIDAAIEYTREVASSGPRDMRWRALLNIGAFYYRQHNYEEALKAFSDAARALEEVEDPQREEEGVPYLMTHIADVAKDTGHYEAALALWTRSLAQATEEKRADVFLESLLNMAQCCQLMGKISEARQRLEQAIVLSSFMFDDQNRLGVARARLADVMAALGWLEEARENARSALRIATKVGGPRGMILSSMALAETCLAAGQYDDALSYVDDAIREAQRSRRPHELAQARNTRARICLQLAREDESGGWLREAGDEAQRALEVADRVDASREKMVAHLTIAQCRQLQGDETGAEEEVQKAIDIAQNGAVSLPRLMGDQTQNLPRLLKSPQIDIEKVFAGRALQLPAQEWQAHYLLGTLRAKRLGPDAAFVAMRDAAEALGRLLTGLTVEDARHFRQHHPEIAAVYEDLARFALTEADQQAARALLQSAQWLGVAGEHTLPALPGG
jgi:tetratricopeptide (TPR) repeat protein